MVGLVDWVVGGGVWGWGAVRVLSAGGAGGGCVGGGVGLSCWRGGGGGVLLGGVRRGEGRRSFGGRWPSWGRALVGVGNGGGIS